MMRLTLTKLFFALLLLLSATSQLHAQDLEFNYFRTYQYTEGSWTSPATVFVDISDTLVICGYYENPSGANTGLLYFMNGKVISYSYPGYTHTELTGINKDGLIIGRAYNDPSSAVVIRGQLSGGEITGMAVLGAFGTGTFQNPKGLNNNNVAGGSLYIGTTRWMRLLEVLPPVTVDKTVRYSYGSTNYNTYGLGISDDNMGCGYYINSTDYVPLTYSFEENEFYTFNNYGSGGIPHTRFNDINSNGYVAVSYKEGIFKATVAKLSYFPVNWASYESDFPFQGPQGAEALGINEKNDITGYYTDATGNKIAYFALSSEYKIPGFKVPENTFAFDNLGNTASDPLYDQLNYASQDPWTSDPVNFGLIHLLHHPLLKDADLSALSLGFRFPTWRQYVMAVGQDSAYTNVSGTLHARPEAITKWLSHSTPDFEGYCFGMSVFAMAHFSDQDELLGRFGNFIPTLPSEVHVYGPGGPYWNDIKEDIGALHFYQHALSLQPDKERFQYVTERWQSGIPYDRLLLYDTTKAAVRDLEQRFFDTLQHDSLYVLGVWLNDAGGGDVYKHAVLPFKVNRHLSLTENIDTIYALDPNKNSSYIRIIVNYDTEVSYALDETGEVVYQVKAISPYGQLADLRIPQYPTMLRMDQTGGKGITGAKTYGSYHQVNVRGACSYQITNTDAPGETITYAPGSYPENNYPGLYASYNMDEDSIADAWIHPTALDIVTRLNGCEGHLAWHYGYPGGDMIVARKEASASDEDLVWNSQNEMAVTPADGSTHTYTLMAITVADGTESQVIIDSLGQNSGDTARLIALNPNHLTLQNNQDNNHTYNVRVTYLSTGAYITRSLANIPLSSKTTHHILITPEADPATQVQILIDSLNDGVIEDTLNISFDPLHLAGMSSTTPSVRCFPNPVQTQLTFQTHGLAPGWSYRIIDPTGRVMLSGQVAQASVAVDMRGLAAGVYFAALRDASGRPAGMLRVVKQ